MVGEILTIDVAAAVISRQGNFLVCQRPWNKHHGGLWEFPGGKVDANENLPDALKRELREELGLYVKSIGKTLFSASEFGSNYKIHFIQAQVSGELVLHEHINARYCSISEIRSLPVAPIDQEFLTYLEQSL